MRKKFRLIAAGLVLAMGLSACAQEDARVSVQRADKLSAASGVADSFAGVVVSDNAVQVQKEMDKTVKDLLVKTGDQVKEGQKLFSYDTDELNLTLDKQELEMDRLEAQVDDLEDEVKDLEKQIKNEKDSNTKATLELSLRQAKMDLTQSQYDVDALEADIKHTKSMLKNVHVYSSVDGTVRSVDENNSEAYIVIQQTGAYRVKGTLNEMAMNMGIMAGANVRILSRLNPDQVWNGVVELVDYENAEQNGYDSMYYGYAADSMTSSSSYPFYIALETTEGLLLGQHVYIQLAAAEPAFEGLSIPETYLMDWATNEDGEPTAAVWAVGPEDTLQKRSVVLGEFDMNTGSYQILEGLEARDYVADPANPNCREGAPVSFPAEAEAAEPTGETEQTDASEEDGTLTTEQTGVTEAVTAETAEPTDETEETEGGPAIRDEWEGLFGTIVRKDKENEEKP